jgi:hypothetical protein
MMSDPKEEEHLAPVDEKFTLECIKNSDVKISHKFTIGSLENQCFCVRFDPQDKYIA